MSSDTRTISQLPIASALTGDELVAVVQGGITKRASINQIETEALISQQFVTVDSEPGLPQSRQLTATGGLLLTDNGALSTFALTTTGLLNSLSSLGASGIVVNSSGTAVARSLTPPAEGITIANATGVAGNPTFALADDLAALEGLGGTGIAVRSATSTWVQRSVAGTGNEITVANGSGVGGNPTVSLPAALTFTGKTVTGGTFSSPSITAASNLTTNGYVKTSGGVGTLGVEAIPIPATDGGSGFSSYAVGDILYASTTTALSKLPDVAAGSFLRSGGVSTAPAWSTTTWPNSAAQGDINYASAVNTFTTLVKDTNATRYLGNTGASNNPAWTQINLANGVTGTLPVANGGTGAATFTAHGVLLGEATSAIVATAAMTDGQVLVGQTGADPLPKTASGDITIAASGAVTIANNAVTNAKLADMATQTIRGRTTAGTGDPEDLTPAQVAAMFASPQVTVQTTGSGTYTTPTGAKFLQVELVGGGGGGAGSGTAAGNGGVGVASTFGSSLLTANGGGAGSASVSTPVTGGTATGGDVNLVGGSSSGANGSTSSYGGMGGSSFFGGAGPGGQSATAGVAASTNSGSGGGGAGDNVTANTGGGGSAGGYCRKLIASPSATYAYVVGTGGAAGTAGTGGTAGGAGAAGIIIITAYFQ